MRRDREAVIDVGSSTIKGAAYDFGTGAPALLLEADGAATGLGRGLVRGALLDPAARAASLEAISALARRFAELGAALRVVVATEALRQAADREAFLAEVRARVGPGPRVLCIDGESEARFALASAEMSLALAERPLVAVDPGGSSNDFARRDADGTVRHLSLPFGMNQLMALAPPDAMEARLAPERVAVLEAFCRRGYLPLAAMAPDSPPPARLAATSGAAIALGAALAGAPAGSRQERARAAHGVRVTRRQIASLIEEAAPMSAAERRARWPSLTPVRAGIFAHGAICYAAMLDRLELDELTVNGFGMKLGALVALGAGPA